MLKKKDRLCIVWSATNYAIGQTETYTWHEVSQPKFDVSTSDPTDDILT